jgi:peptidoglycan/LPS O-acetylase OafA/YrhL
MVPTSLIAPLVAPGQREAGAVVGDRVDRLHRNNLDAVRLAAAFMVLVGHSYALKGLPEHHFLSWLPLGSTGVYIFFSISGYLVVASWRQDSHPLRFLARRALRIFPGLTVCILLSAFVLGPALTALPLAAYFRDSLTTLYLWNIALYPVFPLPGIFQQNVLAGVVNGSLWTLPVEFLMYLGVCAVGLLRGNRWVFLALAVASMGSSLGWAHSATTPIVFYASDLRQVVLCGAYFWMGAVFHEFDIVRHISPTGTLVAAIVMLCLEPWTELLRAAAWLLLPAIVLSFGLTRSPALARMTSRGDYSYGLYIYAFPVQQTVAALWPQLPIGPYIVLVSGIVMVLAALSWHWVERPALAWKPGKPGSK